MLTEQVFIFANIFKKVYKPGFIDYNIGKMELKDKQDHVIRCIKLGMDLQSAMYCAECTVDEMEVLNADEQFQHKVTIVQHLEEYRLLEDHEIAMKIAASKGNASPIQWKLAHMNPGRWGGGSSDNGDSLGYGKIVFEIPDNGRGDGN